MPPTPQGGGAAGHLYWSSKPSNSPPAAVTAEAARAAARADATISEAIWTPIYKWGQRRNKVILTIFVPCLEKDDATVDVKPRELNFRAGRVAVFAGNKKEQRVYTLSLRLRDDVDSDATEVFLRHDHVRVEMPKARARPWRTLQAEGIPKRAHHRAAAACVAVRGACAHHHPCPFARHHPPSQRPPAAAITRHHRPPPFPATYIGRPRCRPLPP